MSGLNIVAGLAGSIGGASATAIDADGGAELKRQEKEDRQLQSLERRAEEASRRATNDDCCSSRAEPQDPTALMIQLVPPSRGDPISSLCVAEHDELLIALTSSGQCLVIGSLAKGLLERIELDETRLGAKVALGPPLDWRGLSTFVQDEQRYVVAWAWPPSHIPSADAQTTLAILVVDGTTKSAKECGRHAISGLMQVGVMKNEQGPPTIIVADTHECRVIPLLFGDSGQQTPLKTSRSPGLAGLFTPSPSRPASRSGADDEHGGLAQRLLGKRARKSNAAAASTVNLATSKVVKTFGEDRLTGLCVSSRGLLITWRGALVEVYRSAGSTLHPYPQTIAAAGDVSAVSTSAHDHHAFISGGGGRCEVYTISSRHHATHLLLNVASGRSFAMLGRSVCRLGDGLSVGQVVEQQVRWRSIVGAELAQPARHVVPLGDRVLVGGSDGSLCRRQLGDVLASRPATNEEWAEDDPCRLDAEIRCLRLFEGKTGPMIVAGDADGTVRCWRASDLSLLETFPVFAQAVERVIPFDGKMMAICDDGTLAVIDVDDLHLLYLVPGSRYALVRAVATDNDLTLSYANGKARVWNMESREFRRSTAYEAAEEMLGEGKRVDDLLAQSETTTCLRIDLQDLCVDRRVALAALHAFGVDAAVDEQLAALGVHQPKHALRISFENHGARQVISSSSSIDVWRISPRATSLLQLLVVSLLRPLMDQDGTEAIATQVITFYVALLPEAVDGFQDGDLSTFAWYYADVDPDVHQAARLLFDARLARTPDEVVTTLADADLGQLPTNQPQALHHSPKAAFTLTLFAAIALQKYQLLSTACLKDISHSILLYLGDDRCAHLAIDLCARGFSIWQSYVDPSDLLRALFALVVSRQASPAVIAQARVATLKLATTASALFVTTLSMDVIAAETVPARESAMKLCVFVARKRPEALYPNLPRLVEAVVRSLDPTRVTARESIQRAATVILGELVATFPSVDFAAKTQKLAVGTREGATIVYDIKTATRLYVLEAHHGALSALKFSPDGRRLVTVSVDERKVNVWKVGASLGSLFVVGGPPRQGGEAGKPFKAIEFALVPPSKGDDLDPATGAPRVVLAWPGDRTASLQIGDTKLTFAT